MLTVPKFKFSEPRRNLPGRKGVATAEDRFTIGFARAYRAQAASIHRRSAKTELALAREIPVNGYGIADLVAVAWSPSLVGDLPLDQFLALGDPTLRAFEAKLGDWRGGLSQANRYRFFAHQSILVLPPVLCGRALEFLDTFCKVKVGLWSFDPASERIVAFHTPRPASPRSAHYHRDALEKMNRAARQALPIV